MNFYSPLISEEKIDIWNNKKNSSNSTKQEIKDVQKNTKIKSSQTIQALEKIQIQEVQPFNRMSREFMVFLNQQITILI